MNETEMARLGASLERHDLAGALKYLTSLASLDPTRSSVLFHMGYVHRLMGDLDGAVRFYREAIRLDPECASYHHGLGIALQLRGELDEAELTFRRAIELEPNLVSAWNSLALTLKKSGHRSRALQVYEQTLDLVGRLAGERVQAGNPSFVQERVNEAGEGVLYFSTTFSQRLEGSSGGICGTRRS